MNSAQAYFTKFAKVLAIALVGLLFISFVFNHEADAATGIRRTINFQGKLVNTNGTNVANGNYSIVFSIYDVSSGGTALWTETQGSVSVTDGVFQVELGSSTAFPADFNFNWDGRYLGVNVAADGEMTPRIRLTAVPYAFNSERVAGLTVQDDAGNASTSATLRIANGKTVTISNGLTFAGTDSTTITFQGTDTYVGRATTDTLTNKTIGSTGLIYSGATTDITTASNEDLTLAVNGSGNFVFSTDFDSGITLGTAISNEFPLLVRSGIGNNAAFVVDNLNNGDLFTASASGVTKFTVSNGGNITAGTYNGNTITTGTGTLTIAAGKTFTSSNTLTLSGTDGSTLNIGAGGTLGTNAYTSTAYAPLASPTFTGTVTIPSPFTLGATSVTSTGTQLNYLNAATGTTGTTTTNLVFSTSPTLVTPVLGAATGTSLALGTNPAAAGTLRLPNATYITARNAANSADINMIQIDASNLVAFGANTAAFTLGGAITGNSQSITGVNSLSSTSLTITGSLTANGSTGTGLCLNGGATAAWGSCGGSNWTLGAGFLTPNNSTADLLIGGQSTASAKFAFTGLSDLNNQTRASISGQLIVMPNNGYGNVGIGTTTPTDPLQIALPAVGSNSYLKLTSATATAFNTRLGTTASNQYAWFTNVYYTGAAFAKDDATRGAWRMNQSVGTTDATSSFNIDYFPVGSVTSNSVLTVKGTANGGIVGIGTTSPLGTFDVRANSGTLAIASVSGATSFAGLVVDNSGLGDIFTASSSGLNRFVITQGGNVGIGTTSPSTKLYLASSDGDLRFDDITAGTASTDAGLMMNGGGSVESAMFTELNGQILSYGINVPQITTRNTQAAGGIFRFDTRVPHSFGNSNAFVIKRYANQSSTEVNALVLDLNNGDTFLAPITGGRVAVGMTATPSAALHVSGGQWGGNAAAIINQAGATTNDIFTASAGGTARFTITNAGGIKLGTAEGTNGDCLKSGGAGAAATFGSCGGGGNSGLTLDTANGVVATSIQTTDIVFGGTSTGSGKFVFGGMNAGTPTATFSGDLIINNKPTTAASNMQAWSKITGTAGTIGGGTASIASVSASVVYNGSLYVGTQKAASAEVYRYSGTSGTWTQLNVTGTPGKFNTTTGIEIVSSMIVYNGKLYIGTTKSQQAEVYRYDGGTTWTQINITGTAGKFNTTTAIDGVSSMAVYGGKLYIGTAKASAAELYRYEGGTTWTIINTTAGTFVTTNTAAVNAVTSMAVFQGNLYLGLKKTGDADVVRYPGTNPGASIFLAMNAAGTTGSYSINAAAVTAFDEVPSMFVWGNRLIVSLKKANAAEVVYWNANSVVTTSDVWIRLNSAAGTIATGGTASIDAVPTMAVYNGRLYIGTLEANSAQIYRYEGNPGVWTTVSQNTAGTIAGGGTTSIDAISTLISFNHNSLFAGTQEGTSAEGYYYTSSIDESYSLKFHASDSQSGGEQNLQQNLASIFFVASLSANINNKAGNTGAFVFSHNIITNNGAYDVSEDYPTRDDTLEPGDLVSIDTNEREFVKKSSGAYDYSVVGIYSENPALRLSQDSNQINGGYVIPVALAGRVPVKVSTENGEIKSGDPLASSSTPGVAMKAKKSGLIIGQAMESYSDKGIGKVLVYIKSTTYNGSIAENFTNIDVNSKNFGDDVLTALNSQDTGLSASNAAGAGSSVITDRLIANIEIVSQKITVDTLFAKRIKADQIDLSADAWQRALQAGGLSVITDRIDILSSQIATVSSALTDKTEGHDRRPGDETAEAIKSASASSTKPPNDSSLTLINSDGFSTISGNLRVKNNGLFEGILSVIDTFTTNNFIVNGLSTLFGDVIFKAKVAFEGPVTFSGDTGGVAVISKDEKRVEVVFDKEFDEYPIINASVSFNEEKNDDGSPKETSELEQAFFAQGYSYIIVNKSKKGFVIAINKKAEEDIGFTWTALLVKDAKIIQSGPHL